MRSTYTLQEKARSRVVYVELILVLMYTFWLEQSKKWCMLSRF